MLQLAIGEPTPQRSDQRGPAADVAANVETGSIV
jgi:hypothetical protein